MDTGAGAKAQGIIGATNAQLEARVKALETWRITIAIDAYKAATKTTLDALAARIGSLETKLAALPAAKDWTTDFVALKARMDAIEAKTCPQESRIATLEADHVPTP